MSDSEMRISALTDDQKMLSGIVSFDTCGNVYFDFEERKEYFNNSDNPDPFLYQIDIDKNNNPYGFRGSYNIISDEITKEVNYGKIVERKDKQKKQDSGKGMEKQDDEKETKNDDEGEGEEETKEEYYQEDQKFKEEIYIDGYNSDSSSDEDNTIKNMCFLSRNLEKVIIVGRVGGDIAPLYETVIYKNNIIVYKTSSVRDLAIYRFGIECGTNKCSLKTTCGMYREYDIKISKDGLLTFTD